MSERESRASCQRHKTYRLTCDDFNQLLSENGNLCQLCGTPGPDTWRGLLVIDHDHGVGLWAVRGLLCPRCNTRLGRGPLTEQQVSYLARPWYRQRVRPLTLPEPDDGTQITDGTNGSWERRGDLWHPVQGYYREAQSWKWLLHMFGPHRIVPQMEG